MRARSTSGTTVSSKPTMPGRLGSPRPSRASRLARISALTGRKAAPLSRSSPSVVGAGEGVAGVAGSVTSTTVRRRLCASRSDGLPARRRLPGSTACPSREVRPAPRRAPGQRRRRRGGGRAARRRRPAHPAVALARARRPGRRPGVAQVREPAAHRLVQDPRGLHAHRPADRRRARPRAWSPPAPATTRRASPSPRACWAPRPPSSCRRPRRCRRSPPPARYGAEVRLGGPTLTEALRRRRRVRRADRLGVHPPLRPPRRHRRAGHGRAWRSSSSARTSRTVVVCTGGGGLVSGIAAAVKARRPDVRVVAVQAEAAAGFPGSLAAGRPVRAGGDGHDGRRHRRRRARRPHPRPRRGAWSTRCARSPRRTSPGRCCSAWSAPSWSSSRPAWPRSPPCWPTRTAFAPPVVAVVSGGNIDPVLLLKVVQHGMAAAGRYLSLRLRVPDRPGVARRACWPSWPPSAPTCWRSSTSAPTPRLHLGEVEVFVVLETRGPDHAAEVAGRAVPGGVRGQRRLSLSRPMSSGVAAGGPDPACIRRSAETVVRRSRKAVGNCHRRRLAWPA